MSSAGVSGVSTLECVGPTYSVGYPFHTHSSAAGNV
jgi:hypothetical protein